MLPLTHNNIPISMSIGMGLAPKMRNIAIYGHIPATNTSRQLVWELGGEIADTGIFQTTAQDAYLSSNNVADVSTLTVSYLGADYGEIVEEVTLNGQIGVQLAQQAIRINHISNLSNIPLVGNVYAGTEPAPAGGIPALANTMQYVDSERQVDSAMIYTVPLGHTLLVTDFSGGNTRNEENDLRGDFTLGEGTNFITGLDIQLTSQYVDIPINYFALPEKSNIVATTQSNTGNNDVVRGRLTGILVENSLLTEEA